MSGVGNPDIPIRRGPGGAQGGLRGGPDTRGLSDSRSENFGYDDFADEDFRNSSRSMDYDDRYDDYGDDYNDDYNDEHYDDGR